MKPRQIQSNTFAEACFNDNSITELAEALMRKTADKYDMEEWKIDAEEWRQSVFDALCAKDPTVTGARGGAAKSARKKKASRVNGLKGGRPLVPFYVLRGDKRSVVVDYLTRGSIVHEARALCDDCGEGLESVAGIRVIVDENGEGSYERQLEGKEELQAAVDYLAADGVFEIFSATPSGGKRFIEAAKRHGKDTEKLARGLVKV